MSDIAEIGYSTGMETSRMEISHVGRIDKNPAWNTPVQKHSFHELIVVMNGCIHVTIAEQNHIGRKGDVLFYPAGDLHTEVSDPDDPCETLFFVFTAAESLVTVIPSIIHDHNGVIRTAASWAYRYRVVAEPFRRELQSAFLTVILTECRHMHAHPVHPMVEQIRGYISARLRQHIDLDELAAVAGMSKYYFSRKYKALSGRTPMDDVIHLRLEQARNLILTTQLSMDAVAEVVGFSDLYHLSHLFRRKLNMAPSELRG